jgi:hypothetical protein
MKFQTVVRPVKGVFIKFCCLNKIKPRLEEPQICNLFTADYALYYLCMRTAAGNVSLQASAVTKVKYVQRNTYVIVWGVHDQSHGISKSVIYWGVV